MEKTPVLAFFLGLAREDEEPLSGSRPSSTVYNTPELLRLTVLREGTTLGETGSSHGLLSIIADAQAPGPSEVPVVYVFGTYDRVTMPNKVVVSAAADEIFGSIPGIVAVQHEVGGIYFLEASSIARRVKSVLGLASISESVGKRVEQGAPTVRSFVMRSLLRRGQADVVLEHIVVLDTGRREVLMLWQPRLAAPARAA